MEPAAAVASGYPASVDSFPLSRGCDSVDETVPPPYAASSIGCKLRLMCSYGGRIVPRPIDKALCYLGGETRMVAVDRHSPLADLSARLSRDLLGGRSFSLKYKLPNEDLDSLISVSTEEDLEIMIEEIDRISTAGGEGTGGGSIRLPRLRLFLFPSEHSSSVESILEESKSENWFVYALNNVISGMGMDDLLRGSSSETASINCLLGLEDDLSMHSRGGSNQPEPEQLILTRPNSMAKLSRHRLETHSVPDSAMLGNDSSSSSTSSAPSLSNLPPIPVPTDERRSDQCIAPLDVHLVQMPLSSSNSAGQIDDEGFEEPVSATHDQQPSPIPLPTVSASIPTVPTENLFLSDDEKSEHGGILQPPELADVGAITSSSESRPTNFIQNSDAKVSSDPIIPFSVAESPGYPLSVADTPSCALPAAQSEQLQQQNSNPLVHQHPSQFIAANAHYIHHPTASTIFPVQSYHPIAVHPMQQPPQASQIPIYYLPVPQHMPYPLFSYQHNLIDPGFITSSGKPSLPISCAPEKPELPAVSSYGTVAPPPIPSALPPQLIQVVPNRAHPYAGPRYHWMQHPHHAAIANCVYEISAASGHPQIDYSQTFSEPP